MHECCDHCGGLLSPRSGKCFICGAVATELCANGPVVEEDLVLRMLNSICERVEHLEDKVDTFQCKLGD